MLVVPYYPVRDEVLKQIIRLKLEKIRRRLAAAHRIRLEYDDSIVDLVRQRSIEVQSGARNVDHLLANTLLPEISRCLLANMVEGESLGQVAVGVSPAGEFSYKWTPAIDVLEAGTIAAA
jgi:type VI secretion system protein VasG